MGTAFTTVLKMVTNTYREQYRDVSLQCCIGNKDFGMAHHLLICLEAGPLVPTPPCPINICRVCAKLHHHAVGLCGSSFMSVLEGCPASSFACQCSCVPMRCRRDALVLGLCIAIDTLQPPPLFLASNNLRKLHIALCTAKVLSNHSASVTSSSYAYLHSWHAQ